LHRIPQLRYLLDKALNMLLLAVKSKTLHFGVSKPFGCKYAAVTACMPI